MKAPSISVIISTYNSPKWLEKVLIGYNHQTLENFEIVIADSGTHAIPKSLIEKLEAQATFKIKHLRHKDQDSQKSSLLNKALAACLGDYIIMSGGNCIPRSDFIEVHFKEREAGYFLLGGNYKLPIAVSKAISEEDIINGSCFSLKWLKAKGLGSSFKNHQILANSFTSSILNSLSSNLKSWNKHNASGWKSDILTVCEGNQNDNQIKKLGERLLNNGIKAKQIKYTAVCLCLEQSLDYKEKVSVEEK